MIVRDRPSGFKLFLLLRGSVLPRILPALSFNVLVATLATFTHGDLFDGVIQHAKWLAYLGDSLYTLTLLLNRWFNRVRTRFGFPYWSLSQYLKHQVKNAVNFISAFEQVMADEARRRGCDGVVCGHIHKPEIREIDGLLYCNDGDWVESLSALVETAEGELRIVHWTHKRATRAPAKVTPVSA